VNVGFNMPLNIQLVISQTSLSRQLIAHVAQIWPTDRTMHAPVQ